jgi:hypothetical protein
MRKRYSGLDLSGYSRGRSGLAEIATSDDGLVATIYRSHPFAQVAGGRDLLNDMVAAERTALNRMTSLGMVLVDMPIDVEDLFRQGNPIFVWELTARPVDFAFGGLRPLADRIGAAVARFRHCAREQPSANLRETYPAASLNASGLPSTQYKDETITWDAQEWEGGRLAEIATKMRLVPAAPVEVTDDEIDAIVCAFAGAAPAGDILSGDALKDMVRQRISNKIRKRDRTHLDRLTIPSNYQLFHRPPTREVRLRMRQWNEVDP